MFGTAGKNQQLRKVGIDYYVRTYSTISQRIFGMQTII